MPTLPLPIGKIIEFRCNGRDTARLVIATTQNELSQQIAVGVDGMQWRHVPVDLLIPHGKRRGIGFYDTATSELASPEQIRRAILNYLDFGWNAPSEQVIDLFNQPIRVCLQLVDDKLHLIDAIARAQYPDPSPVSAERYWRDLYDKIKTVLV